MNFGTNLRKLRLAQGIGLNELAAMIGEKNSGNLSRLENGKAFPSWGMIMKLANTLKRPAALLLKEESNLETATGLRLVPVLDNIAAGNPIGVAPIFRGDESGDYEPTDVPGHSNLIAFKIKGDSMEPEFKAGDTIFADPNKKPHHRSLVIAVDEAGEGTFKEYWEVASKDGKTGIFELRPLNPVGNVVRRSDEEPLKIKGVVVSHLKKVNAR